MNTADSTQKRSNKKRLSRKEQKARKKQKQPSHSAASKKETLSSPLTLTTTCSSIPEATPASPTTEDASITPPPIMEDDKTVLVKTTIAAVSDLSSSYIPTPIPTWDDIKREHKQSLGKWFPNAVIVKCKQLPPPAAPPAPAPAPATTNGGAALVLFYQYTKQPWPESRVSLLIAYLHRLASTRHVLGGRIRVAPEGVNATVSSVSLDTLRMFALDLQHFDAIFNETHFKYIDNLSRDRHFCEFKIYPVKELVFYGINGQHDAPLSHGGEHLAPRDFHTKLTQSNTVVIDVRNHYEAAIGRFDGQEYNNIVQKEKAKTKTKDDDESEINQEATASGAATYIDPKMRKSTDFPTWLAQTGVDVLYRWCAL
jgi:UPF0176 acylphosphatase like domain